MFKTFNIPLNDGAQKALEFLCKNEKIPPLAVIYLGEELNFLNEVKYSFFFDDFLRKRYEVIADGESGEMNRITYTSDSNLGRTFIFHNADAETNFIEKFKHAAKDYVFALGTGKYKENVYLTIIPEARFNCNGLESALETHLTQDRAFFQNLINLSYLLSYIVYTKGYFVSMVLDYKNVYSTLIKKNEGIEKVFNDFSFLNFQYSKDLASKLNNDRSIEKVKNWEENIADVFYNKKELKLKLSKI